MPALVTVPHWAARTVVPVGAAMSLPAWVWVLRCSPKVPVVVPETGEAILPAPQPVPVVAGAGAGAGAADGSSETDWVFVTASRLRWATSLRPVFGFAAFGFCVEVGCGLVCGFVVAAGPSTPASAPP